MRAVTISEFGGPEVLIVSDVPEPEPGPDEVCVRVAAASVNPTDILLRKGLQTKFLRYARSPYIPGMDIAGVVESIGSRVSGVSVGSSVIGALSAWGESGGGQAELVTLPASSVTAAPSRLSFVESSTLPMNGLTADAALTILDIEPGGCVAVAGAAGAVGGLAVELAVSRGLKVIAVARAQDRDLATRMGAHHFVERGDAAYRAVRAMTNGGVDGLIDAANVGRPVFDAVRDDGRVVRMMPYSGPTERGIKVERVFVVDHLTNTSALERIRDLAEVGAVSARVAETLPFERVSQAHRATEAGGTRGRFVLVPVMS